MKRAIAIVAVVTVAMSVSAQAGIYKWVDSDGKVHYSDKPVAGAAQAGPSGPGLAAPPGASPEAEAAAKVAQEQCDRARKQRETYEKADQLVQEDSFGRKTTVSTEDRVQLILRARENETEFCNRAAAEPAPAAPAAETQEETALETNGGSANAPE